jgi:hypothetical protein
VQDRLHNQVLDTFEPMAFCRRSKLSSLDICARNQLLMKALF